MPTSLDLVSHFQVEESHPIDQTQQMTHVINILQNSEI